MRDGGEMNISEKHQCYVYGQCQVIESLELLTLILLNILNDFFLPFKGIFHQLQPARRCWGLSLLLRQARQMQLVVLGTGSVPLPGLWKLHCNRRPKWFNLPWLYQRRKAVSSVCTSRAEFRALERLFRLKTRVLSFELFKPFDPATFVTFLVILWSEIQKIRDLSLLLASGAT